MTRNEGTLDRGIRITVGFGLLVFAIATGNALGLLGLIPLATGIAGICPVYRVLGIHTRGQPHEPQSS